MPQGAKIECHHCGTIHHREELPPGGLAICRLCGSHLYRSSRLPLSAWMALGIATLIIFGIAMAFPIVSLTFQGVTVDASLPGALLHIWKLGYFGTAIVTGLFAFWFPLTQIMVTLWALSVIARKRLPADFHLGMRLLRFATPWSMVSVFMLGILVALVKMVGLAAVQVQPAIFAFGALTVLITLLSRCSPTRLWLYAEDANLVQVAGRGLPSGATRVASCESCGFLHDFTTPHGALACGRCGAAMHFRHPAWRTRVWAFWLTAAIAYIPANMLPIMTIRMAGTNEAHTILGGVIELWRLGSWDLAVIVFIASVVVPITKLLAIAVLMMGTAWRGPAVQRKRTRMYEMVEIIGQWSMLDVFVVLLMAAMADFPGLSQIVPGPAAFSFGMVVVLTMMAAMSYDPRRGWDARHECAQDQGPNPPVLGGVRRAPQAAVSR